MPQAAIHPSLRVLLVEDNTPDATLVRESLSSGGRMHVDLARVSTLAEGLRSLAGEEFHAILLDLSLPDARGMETLDAMVARHEDVPVLVLTGNDDDEVAHAALRRGAQDYLVKGRVDGYQLRCAITHAVERKRQERRMRKAAFFDELTGLANRALLLERIRACFARGARDPGRTFAVAVLDIDRFKQINDSLGHQAGDAAIVEVARRLSHCVRGVDTVARLGGDEFVVLLEETHRARGILRVMDEVHEAMTAPLVLDGHEVLASLSAGVAFGAGSSTAWEPEDLLRQADTALYRAKARGQGLTELFDGKMQEEVVVRQRLETDLRRALSRDEFVVRYQPRVRLADGAISGFEALVRWRRAGGALELPPSQFISAAEDIGVIHEIRGRVLREACSFLRALPDFESLSISVNLSTACFLSSELDEQVRKTLAATDLPPACLQLEITEDVLQGHEDPGDRMAPLRELGVHWHLDDFGTGFSSFQSLEDLPITGIHIDRAFVSRAWRDGRGPGLVRSIAVLAHDLGLDIVAEGIETKTQRDELRDLHCQYGQGFLFGRPLTADRAAARILSARRDPTPDFGDALQSG
jgi:diguanylate cyclase (GGDEF)-like protein